MRAIADQQTPGWTRLDLLIAPEPEEGKTSTTQISVIVPGWGPDFFPVVLQVDPLSGEIRNIHSWDDLSSGGRLLAWSRWLHKGDAFGRAGQIVAGLACVVLLFLIVTGWSLATRRLAKSLLDR